MLSDMLDELKAAKAKRDALPMHHADYQAACDAVTILQLHIDDHLLKEQQDG